MNKIIALSFLLYFPRLGFAAATFDGGNNYININGTTMSDFVNASTCTIAAWIRPTGSPSNAAQAYSGQGIVGENSGYIGIYRSSNAFFGGDRIICYNWGGGEQDAPVPYTPNEWVHITLVHNAGALYCYKNGILGNSIASGDTSVLAGFPAIGFGYGGGVKFIGDVDDVRIYNRALSESEIEKLATSRTRVIMTDNLTGWWKLDDGIDGAGIGTAGARDWSGRGKRGTGVGNALWKASNWIFYP